MARTPSGAVALHFFVPDKDLRLSDPELEVEIVADAADPGTVEIVVTATALARHLALLADRVSPDAVSDDALVTLLPGRSHTFRVAVAAPFDADRLKASGALRHLAGIAPAAD